MFLILTQVPCPEQSLGHAFLSHAAPMIMTLMMVIINGNGDVSHNDNDDIPVNPEKHLHSPDSLSHVPLLEHSASRWALPSAEGRSAHAKPAGHANNDDNNDGDINEYDYVRWLWWC